MRRSLIRHCWGLFVLLAGLAGASFARADCPPVERLGPAPTRLVVITPATGQGRAEWVSFIEAMKREPGASDMAVLFFTHGISRFSQGSAAQHARQLGGCISEKLTNDPALASVTLVGHSIGGMLTRRAYLDAVDARDPQARWSARVDRILLFTSVNRGVPALSRVSWLAPLGGWLLRNVPRFGLPIHFVLEDLLWGSDFIADVRISWIRHFGDLARSGRAPRVVQFWGTEDSVVTEDDNADLKAFSGEDVLVRVAGAQHGNLQRLEPSFTADPAARWALFREPLFGPAAPVAARTDHPPRRVLFILRGIRDSSYANWVSDLRARAVRSYGEGNVIAPEYGFFTAAQFALKPIRRRNIPAFRDLYVEQLALNPRTEFDVIAHSNGTYIVAESLDSTPSMKLRHVVLAAPVLPLEFPWTTVFDRKQVERLRYDTAQLDWPVGILCPLLRAIGFSDVGPAGLVLFGASGQWSHDGPIRHVGWYPGGHGAALAADNRAHLLGFADRGDDLGAAEQLQQEAGALGIVSRLTPYLFWLLIAGTAWRLRTLSRRAAGRLPWGRIGSLSLLVACLAYVLLDAF